VALKPKDAFETSAFKYDFEICPESKYHILKNAIVYNHLTQLISDHSLISER
jgi:hypothetical protein